MNSARRSLKPRDHQDKEVQQALKQILSRTNPSFELLRGGHWGTLWCSNHCCQIPVSGTPRVPGRHARDLMREADKCPRCDGDARKRQRRR